MLKYLIIALVIALLFYSPMLRTLRGKPRDSKAPAPPQRPAKAEEMVQCAHCGVHLPDGDALRDAQGHAYCGAAHRQAGPARG
jgi:uncharacterized protein